MTPAPAMSGQAVVRLLDASSADARGIIRLSDCYSLGLYPPESTHLEGASELARPNVTFAGAWLDAALAGCGAVKLMSDDGRYGEIKRLFVVEAHRGKGVAKALMSYLEQRLRDAGIGFARLETGVRQPEALSLYRGLGYVEREPFGRYRRDPLSVFMEKRLV